MQAAIQLTTTTRPAVQCQSQAPRLDQPGFLAQVQAMRLPYLRVSLSKDCNAACGFCHNEGQAWGRRGGNAARHPARLPLAAYGYIADFYRPVLSRVKFTGGEPTLVIELPEIIETFHRRGYDCSMTSNGFNLDYDLQRALAARGLRQINISFHTTDEEAYAATFGVAGQMKTVLRNLETLHETFPAAAKLNFFALRGQNVPSQLVPMTELSAQTRIPVSFLTDVRDQNHTRPLSVEIIEHLTAALGEPVIDEVPDDFFVKRFYRFPNGGVWEIDDFRRAGYREDSFNNPICRACPKQARCTEGPYALRIHEDGTARPCLIRRDNELAFADGAYLLSDTR